MTFNLAAIKDAWSKAVSFFRSLPRPSLGNGALRFAGTTAIAVVIFAILPFWAQMIIAFIVGILIALIIFALIAPIFKERLKHDPSKYNEVKMLVEVQPGRHTVIIQGGRPRYVIEGGKFQRKSAAANDELVGGEPDAKESWFYPWFLIQRYMYATTGYHAYIPFFTKPYTYELPRYELVLRDDKTVYVAKSDRSNHVRVETTTWYFEYHEVDIQKIPFLIRGSVQFRIVPGKELWAMFMIESWNVLLDQALNSTIRNYLRRHVTLDNVLGATPSDIWQPLDANEQDYDSLGKGIRDKLDSYMIEQASEEGSVKKTLLQLGIEIQRVDIVDFADELPKEERARFYAAVIGREEGRAIDLRGQGTAKAEAALLAAHKDGGEVSETIIKSRALVDAAKGSDILGALAAGLARKQM